MFEKTLPAVVLTVVCAASGFGQQTETQKEKIEKPCAEPQILAERIAEAQKKQNIDFNGKITGRRAVLKNFLPSETSAWVVEIVTTGGFSGKGLPTLTVTSNGDLFVASDDVSSPDQLQPTDNRKLKADVLQKISQIVNAQSPTETVKNAVAGDETTQADTAFLCNDCYQTSITVVRREASGEIRYFSNREKNLLFSTGDYNQIYRIITENIRS